MITNGQTSVATSGQTAIVTALGDATVYLRNQDATNFVALGNSTVTTANGRRLLTAQTLEVKLHKDETLYGQADTAAVVVEWLLVDSLKTHA